MKKISIFLLLVLVKTGESPDASTSGSDVVSFTDVANEFNLRADAFTDKQTLIPVASSDTTMEATLDINLASVNKFDSIGGYLEISGYLHLTWTDSAATDTGYDVSLLLSSRKTWKPPLLLVNSLKGTSEIGDLTSKVRCNIKTWNCEWQPWVVLRGGCIPDVRFYPFDRQHCHFKLAAWGQLASELTLRNTRNEWDMELYEENAAWTVIGTSSTSYIQNNVSIVEFSIKLRRIPTYYIINLIAPVILLAVVNVCVFILPTESGERIGFSITCFLSFIVLLGIVMTFIPASSANLAYLCYYTFIMMIFSCAMSLATLLTLWIHFKSENGGPVPLVLRGFMYVLTCQCFKTPAKKKKTASNVITIKTLDSNWDEEDNEDDKEGKQQDSGGEKYECSWQQVASVMDVFFLLGFLGAQAFYSVAYLLPLILNE